MGTGEWRIEAHSLNLDIGDVSTPFYHDFWVLVDPDGNVIQEIHGLAVDPNTGKVDRRGDSRCLLQEKIYYGAQDYQINQPTVVEATGDEGRGSDGFRLELF